jgi:hypothetical protein
MPAESLSKPAKLFFIIFSTLILANLTVLNIYTFFNLKRPEAVKPTATAKNYTSANISQQASPEQTFLNDQNISSILTDCQQLCEEKISQAISTVSSRPQTKPEQLNQTIIQEKINPVPEISYVVLGGGISTSNRDWSYIGGAEAYFNKAYYKGAKKIIFEAFLKIKSGNGQANTRLYDTTNQVVIANSEIFGGGETYVLRSSQPLTLLDGNNLYQVQLRSTTGYEAFMEGARFKIEY